MAVNLDLIEKSVEWQHAEFPFSGVMTVRENGEAVFERAYGLANRADELPNRVDTRFAMASGSKIFTAVAICQLVEKGLIGFDSRLKDCLDVSFPHFDPGVTIEHLLTHTSGIPDYFDEEVEDDYEALWKERPMYNMRGPRDFLPMFQQGRMKFSPGERFGYSDGGFVVLGLVIEQHTEMPFVRYVEENVLKRAGMTDSGYFATDRLPGNTAYNYIDDETGGGWRTNIFAVPVIGEPDGGAFTTAGDMTRFWSALFENRLLDGRLTAEMIQPRVKAETEGENLEYGYGIWCRMSGEEIKSYYVTGWDPGVAFQSEVFPKERLEINVIGNANKPTFPMYRALLRAIGRE